MADSPRQGPDGRPQAFREKCSTCIFRPGNPMRLRPGRLQDVVRANLAAGAVLTCHQTTYGQHPEIGPTACAGFLAAYPGAAVADRFARLALGGWHLIDPPDRPAADTPETS